MQETGRGDIIKLALTNTKVREKTMTITMLRVMIALGIVGHAINMYCDRILSIFPNGTIKFDNIKEIEKDGVLAEYVFLQLGRDRTAKDMMLDLSSLKIFE